MATALTNLLPVSAFMGITAGTQGPTMSLSSCITPWDKKFKTIGKHVAAKGAGIGLHIVTADLDADGDLDIVVPGKEGTQILWNRRK